MILPIYTYGQPVLRKQCEDFDPETYLGEKHIEKFGVNFGVLTKFLDSAERLPIQVHPTKDAAKRLSTPTTARPNRGIFSTAVLLTAKSLIFCSASRSL